MDVREPSAKYLATAGYKKTEAGTIPEDWNTERLGKHAAFRTGPFGSALHQSDYVQGGVPVINPMQLVDGKIVPTTTMSVAETTAAKLSDFRIVANEILIGRRGEMGRCAVVLPAQEGWLCGTGSMIIRCKASIDPRFAQRVLSSPQLVAEIESRSVGTTMINLNQGTLSNLVIPIPPTLDEQQAIADALSDADALIESLEHLLAKKRQSKQGAMQALLTGERRLPGFSGKWTCRPLGELGRWVGGMTPSMSNPDYWSPADVPWISSGDVKTTRLTLTSSAVSQTAIRDRATTVVPEGSVVAVMRSGILRNFLPVAITMRQMAINQDIKAIIPSRSVTAEFLLHALTYNGDRILGQCLKSGTTVESIEFPWLKAFEIRLPPAEEQTAIATVLSDMDAEVTALEARLAKARQVKQGMMQVLLTGRIRLV